MVYSRLHTWASANVFLKCAHPQLSEEERQNKQWLKKGSPSHEAVKSVVLDKKLLKDICKLSQFCHTGILEVYQWRIQDSHQGQARSVRFGNDVTS